MLKETKMNEEAVKHSFTLPFIQFMGFDFTDPQRVQPEYPIKIKTKIYRVDYALMQNSMPLVFIEVKHSTDSLTTHMRQITKYFNSTPSVILLILTNGLEYKFFTDLDIKGEIDNKEFFKCNLNSMTDYHEKTLNQLKEILDYNVLMIPKIKQLAHNNREINTLISLLLTAIENPQKRTVQFILAHKDEIKAFGCLKHPLQKKSIIQQFNEKYEKNM
jgi:hypothetical protein